MGGGFGATGGGGVGGKEGGGRRGIVDESEKAEAVVMGICVERG